MRLDWGVELHTSCEILAPWFRLLCPITELDRRDRVGTPKKLEIGLGGRKFGKSENREVEEKRG